MRGRFSYTAVDKTGKHITGTIETTDRRSAVVALAGNGQFIIELAEETGASAVIAGRKDALKFANFVKFGSRKITSGDILTLTTQLSTGLRAGLPMLSALEIICNQQHKPAMKDLLGKIAKSVSSGQSLSESMARYEKVFSPLYLSMIRVGETGGILEQTMTQLSQILGRDEKIKTNMKNASVYPLFVLIVGLISVVIVVTWILPNILATISGGIAILPLPTRIVLELSEFIKFYGLPLLVLLVVAGYYLRRWTKSKGRLKWDAIKLKIPVIGSVLKSIAIGRFARTLGSLTKGGVTILEALTIVRDTLGNELLGRQIDAVADKVKAGASIGGPLEASGYFPPLLVQIVSMGEQTGMLDELLLNAADTFDGEADAAITKFLAIFPAVLILILAMIIGFIIMAILMPLVMMELGAAGGF